jgi:putative autotransporter adhesin-like protein
MTNPIVRSALLASAVVAIATSGFASPAIAKKIEEARQVEKFEKVAANGSTDVIIKVGPKQSVVVHADDKEIQDIKTEVKNGQLTIERDSKRGFRFSTQGAKVIITVPKLTKLASRGSGDSAVSGIKAKNFQLIQQGSGDVDLEGSCESGDIVSQGSGDLDSEKFDCKKVMIKLQGSGDLVMKAFKTTNVELNAKGSGDVTLRGSCKSFDLNHMASGDVDAHKFECEVVSIKSRGSGDMRVFATKDVKISMHGSGDVEVYGGAKASELSAAGSGHVRTH